MMRTVIIHSEFGQLDFAGVAPSPNIAGEITMTGDPANLFALERRIRDRCPDFSLGLSADTLHSYNAKCKLTESSAALVFGEIFRSLTRP